MEALTVQTRRQGDIRTLVDSVRLALNQGEVLALVGASGSGKSLTCAGALGVLPPGAWRACGRVTIGGQERSPEEMRGRLVATILQNPRSAFNPVKTMGAHARETLDALNVPKAKWDDITRAAMADAGLDDATHILRLHPFEMSGGMLRRMMIALALMVDAPFLFADEPTTDLDLVIQREILDLLDRLRAERGLGILLVTHDMGVVARLADRVSVMADGRIVDEDTVMKAFHRPSHPTTRALVEAHLSLYDPELAA
nr:ATP-binding cassette domain-containing protein [Aureimonas mangrovi]